MGNIVNQEQHTPSQLGTVNGEFNLSPEAGTGFYYLEAQIGEESERTTYSGTGFQVAEYRKPEFEVSMNSAEPEYIQGETISVTVNANYFSGGPLTEAPVTWRLIAEPYYFAWSDEDDRRYDFSPYDPDSEIFDPYRGLYSLGLITEGSGITDNNGEFIIEMPADISQSLQSQNWAFDVTLQSPTNQFVSERVSVPVHRAGYYIGMAPRSYVSSVGTQAEVDLVAITPEHNAFPGAKLTLTVIDFDWSSVYERAADGSYRWETSVERTPVYTTTVTTDRDGKAVLQWIPEYAGQYQIVAAGEDDMGNPTSSASFLWVSAADSSEFVAWPMKNNDRIEIVADKQKYLPGDTARILVPSPFQGAVNALVTTERSGVIDAEVMQLQANSEMLEIPITTQHIPNVFVSVILAKGVDDSNPFPALKIGYVMLPVDTAAVEMTLDISASEETIRPGSSVTYTLLVYDNMGQPVPNAEVSAALIDEAVLSLAGSSGQTLLDEFYRERPLDVVTGATLVINQDRSSQQLSEGAKGGGGGGGGMLEVRSDFADVAFWQADLLTDADGRIQFAVELPDSLTTWRLVARAVTDDTMVGEANHNITATKELQIRPLIPRFVTAGDRPWLGAQLINTSNISVTGVLTYSVSGAKFAGDEIKTINYTLGPGEQVAESWPAEVDSSSDEVSVLAVSVATGIHDANVQYQDAVQISLPTVRYESPETVASAGMVPSDGTTEIIVLPPDATEQGSLNVRMEPNLASGMIAGLDYLRHYPYECNEQLVSRFLPNIVTVNALRSLDIDNDELQTQLAYQLGIGVQMLTSRQNPDGGWGYWIGERSLPFITAYVLWGISLAQDEGFAVPENTTASAIAYLDSQFVAPHATLDSWKLNEMAFVHYVLSELDSGDPGRASTLYDVRENLDTYGKAFLAMALANMRSPSEADPRVQTLIDDIVGAAIITAAGAHWEESSVDYWTLNTDTRTTSIVLGALTQLQPDHPLLPQVVRWLMVTRESGRWSNTQETAWSIIGLTDWLMTSKELEGDYDWTTVLNGETIGVGIVMPDTINPPVDLVAPVSQLLRDQANELTMTRSNDSGQMYYSTYLQYYLDAAAIDSRDRGIVVDRRFELLDGSATDAISSANVADIISVTVTLIAPTDLHQVMVEVPIPAGTEPIDPELAVTDSRFVEPSVTATETEQGQRWWQNWVPSNTDYKDDKVVLFSTFVPAGTYEYTFNVRASTPGEYRVLPVYAEMMYFNEVWGRSESSLFTVKPEQN